MTKPFIVANVREVLDQFDSGDITFSRMVEMLNEIAEKFYNHPPIASPGDGAVVVESVSSEMEHTEQVVEGVKGFYTEGCPIPADPNQYMWDDFLKK